MPKNTIIPAAGGPGPAPPLPEHSIRFDRARATNLRGYTPGTNESDRWVMSWWQKITGDLGVNRVIWEARVDANNFTRFELDTLNRPHFQANIGGVIQAQFGGQRSLVDVSNWHHCMLSFDRLGGFLVFSINGYAYPGIQQVPATTIANVAGYVWMGTAGEHFIGSDGLGADNASVIIAEMHCVPAGVLPLVSAFGTFNVNGVWTRAVYGGGHGTAGFYLTFGRTVDLGEDFSGLNNDFTVHTNAAAAGADQFTEWMERNECTLDVNDHRTTGTISNGGLDVAGGVAAVTMRPDFGVWYYEFNGVGVVYDTGISGPFDPLLVAGSYNFGQQLPWSGVGPGIGELALVSTNFPAIPTANAREYVAAIDYAGDSASPKVITDSTGQALAFDTEYADIIHRSDLVWAKTAQVGPWFQAHRLRLGAQLPIDTSAGEETVNANGVITDLPDPGPGFEVTAGGIDLLNFNEFGTKYNALSLHAEEFAQNIVISQGADDSEENSGTGAITLGGTLLDMGEASGTAQLCGVRFQGVQIPQGATIVEARLQFTSIGGDTDVPADFVINCEDIDDAPVFTSTNSDISNRTPTAAQVAWSAVPTWGGASVRGAAQLTSDLATIVQEVVDRGGWANGNSLVFLIDGDSGGTVNERSAFTFENDPTFATELQVRWKEAATPAPGLSLFTYMGTGLVREVMHGLSVVPDMFIIKRATGGAINWRVYNGEIVSALPAPEDGIYETDTSDPVSDSTSYFNDTPPSATHITVGTFGSVNLADEEFVGWAMASMPGFSRVFRYLGNASTNGPEVYLGFKPRFIAIKRTEVAADWLTMMKATDIIGAQNNQFNIMESMGQLNTTANFFQNIAIEAYSSGFKILDLDATVNAAGAEYVGFAFAEAAFQLAKASP